MESTGGRRLTRQANSWLSVTRYSTLCSWNSRALWNITHYNLLISIFDKHINLYFNLKTLLWHFYITGDLHWHRVPLKPPRAVWFTFLRSLRLHILRRRSSRAGGATRVSSPVMPLPGIFPRSWDFRYILGILGFSLEKAGYLGISKHFLPHFKLWK